MDKTKLSRTNLNKIVKCLTNNDVHIVQVIKSYAKCSYYGEILIKDETIQHLKKLLSDLQVAGIKYDESFGYIVVQGEYLDSPY